MNDSLLLALADNAALQRLPGVKRSTAMERRTAGSLELSVLGFGAWQFGSGGADDYWGLEFTDALATELTTQAVLSGVTYIDTAEDYAKGGSESQLGRVLKTLAPEDRAKVVIGSKILPNHCGAVREHCLATLARLQVEAIDLYMVHWPIDENSMAHFAGAHTASGERDYATTGAVDAVDVPPAAQAFLDLAALQKEGLVKNVGVSNFGVKQLEAALATGVTLAANQVCYNLIFRAAEYEIIPYCTAKGIGVLTYSPLMQGLLTGAWATPDEVPTYRARTRHFAGSRPKSRHGEKGHEALLMKTVQALRDISAECGVPLAELAVAWPLHKPGVTTVIAGATKPHQMEANVRAAARKLPAELLEKLDAATAELKEAMGGNCDLWQGLHDDGRFDGRIK